MGKARLMILKSRGINGAPELTDPYGGVCHRSFGWMGPSLLAEASIGKVKAKGYTGLQKDSTPLCDGGCGKRLVESYKRHWDPFRGMTGSGGLGPLQCLLRLQKGGADVFLDSFGRPKPREALEQGA